MIYMDYSATTYVKDEVLNEMAPYFKEQFGNASSVHSMGRTARNAVDLARMRCAKAIGAGEAPEIFFTSGGTESNNLAIRGVCAANSDRGKHVITSVIEHPSVLHTFEDMERNGFSVSYIPVDKDGILQLDELKNAIRPETMLISVMFANNEVGTIQPIREIGDICKAENILFHTDAVQAVGNIPIDVNELNIDLMSVSGHKIYAPKGIGLLYVRKGVKISPVMTGGKQERNKRPGTENVSAIVGFGKAMEMAAGNIVEHSNRVGQLRDKLINGILKNIPNTNLNGSKYKRLCNNANFCFNGIDGDALIINLDSAGICVSSGSACASGSLEPSHVLLAMGLSENNAKSSVRFSLGDGNTMEEIEKVIQILSQIINNLRIK